MELFLDTADLGAVKKLNDILTISGVTTNPSILAKENIEVKDVIKQLDKILSLDQLIFVQVIQTTYEGIMKEAKEIAGLRKKNIYVKIPVSNEGLRAIKECKKLGINTLATAIYSSNQAFCAAMNGADYLAPYVNRMDNYGDGVGETCDLIEMLKVNNIDSKVIAASFKSVNQVNQLIKAGVQAVTLPPDIMFAMINHPGTQIAIDEFSEKWEKQFSKKVLF
jgi:TalC/MipB family fructose-6-phosphate aldolase